MNILAIGLLFLIGLYPTASALADPACRIAADHPLIGDTRWYGLYYEDGKIGHAMTRTAPETRNTGSPDEFSITQYFSMTLKLEQTEETIEQTRRFDAAPPHRLLDGHYKTADRSITYEQRSGDLHLLDNGVSRVWRDVDRQLCDEEDIAIHRFLEGGPDIGARLETTDIDVENQAMITATHDLEGVSTRKIMGAEHVFQTLRTASSSEVFSYTAKTRFRSGEAVNLFLGPIELRAETEAIAHQPNQGVDLFAEFEKPLDRPLSRLPAIQTLRLKASIDDPSITIHEVVSNGLLQRVDYLDDKTAIVEIGEHAAPPDKVPSTTYLRPTSSHPADHPRLQKLVRDIKAPLGAAPDDRTIAEAILHFVAGYIETVPESPYAYHTTSVFDVLDNRTGDCTEHSQLFVTLARAAGLPAREVSGFVYGGDDRAPSLGGHAWVEVMIEGRWIGMDPTWEETELNRSHVQTRNNLVPSLSFEVIDMTYR